MAKGKYKQKKSSSDAKRYRNSLGENTVGISETYKNSDSYLVGSADSPGDVSKIEEKEPPIGNKPISLILKDWLRDNWITTLITILIIPFSVWIIHSIFEIEKNDALRDYRIVELEKDIAELSDNIPNKESLQLELSILKDEVKDLNDQDFETRINNLEQIVNQYD